MSMHYFIYGDEGVEFFKSLEELLTACSRMEDCYVYEGELDEDNYDDSADDYREVNITTHLLDKLHSLDIITEEQKELEGIGKIEEYMDWKRDGDGSLCEFIKTYLGHNDALEEVAREERELRFAAEAENERLKEENEKIKFNADEYEDSLCEIDELNGRIDKLEAWKESAKQQHLKDGTWVSQAREEELSDKIKSLESQLETERSMSEAGLVRGSSTGNCAWYRNLECLRKENDERGETTQRQRVEIEKLKAEMADFKRNVMRQHLIEYAELQVENAKLKAMNEYLNE